jgi:hypothetical protein
MRIERIKPTVFQVTLHAYELAALVAAARWVVGGAEGELPEEAVEQLRKVLDGYDAESRRLGSQ